MTPVDYRLTIPPDFSGPPASSPLSDFPDIVRGILRMRTATVEMALRMQIGNAHHIEHRGDVTSVIDDQGIAIASVTMVYEPDLSVRVVLDVAAPLSFIVTSGLPPDGPWP